MCLATVSEGWGWEADTHFQCLELFGELKGFDWEL